MAKWCKNASKAADWSGSLESGYNDEICRDFGICVKLRLPKTRVPALHHLYRRNLKPHVSKQTNTPFFCSNVNAKYPWLFLSYVFRCGLLCKTAKNKHSYSKSSLINSHLSSEAQLWAANLSPWRPISVDPSSRNHSYADAHLVECLDANSTSAKWRGKKTTSFSISGFVETQLQDIP